MAESREFEYCVLRYVPNVINDEGVLIAAIFINHSDPDGEKCAITFAPYWQEKIRLFDPDSDLEMVAATLAEIRDRLQSPTNRDTLHELEDSFSNTIQISDRRKCLVPANSGSVEALAFAILEKPPIGFVGSFPMRSAAFPA